MTLKKPVYNNDVKNLGKLHTTTEFYFDEVLIIICSYIHTSISLSCIFVFIILLANWKYR